MKGSTVESPKFIDASGRVRLPHFQRPFQRPPFINEVDYWQSLDKYANPRLSVRPADANRAEAEYITNLAVFRVDSITAEQRKKTSEEIEHSRLRVKGMLIHNEDFWDEERIRVTRNLLTDYQQFCRPYIQTDLEFENIPWVIEDPRYLGGTDTVGGVNPIEGIIYLSTELIDIYMRISST